MKSSWRDDDSLAIAVGIFGSLLIISLFELAFFFLNRTSFGDVIKPENAFPRIVATELLIDGAHGIPVSERGVQRIVGPRQAPPAELDRPGSLIKEVPFQIFRRSTGLLMPNTAGKASLRVAATGESIYEAEYSIDSYGRRTTSGQESPGKTKHLAVMGCSFVFGEGLNADETLPADLSKEAPNYRAYNMGIPAGSPANFVLLSQMGKLWEGVKESEGVAAFIFFDGHLTRVFPSMVNVANWGQAMPYLSENADGSFSVEGSVLSQKPFLYLIYKILYHSQMARFFGVNFPYELNEDHFFKFAQVIEQIKRSYLNQFPGQKFYFVGYPGKASSTIKYLKPHLEKLGIDYLDYGQFYLGDFSDKPMVIKYDGHPSAEANRVWAKVLAHDLGLVK